MLRCSLLLAPLLLGCPPAARDPAPRDPPPPAVDSAPPAAPSPAASSAARAHEPPRIDVERARELLYVDGEPAACPEGSNDERIRCLIAERYAVDPQAAEKALALYGESGSVAGLNPARDMDGGWRGQLKLVPELPVGRHARYLEWLRAASVDFNRFFASLGEGAPKRLRYRWQPIELRFFRSVGRTTPSAYAAGWSVAFNVVGSLHSSADAVRETYFHEVFHLNDADHGDWSTRQLTPLFNEILSRCTSKRRSLATRCLEPFAPNDTMVRGGTFYAFQPGNGVAEYAAELAIRYYREHRRVLAHEPPREAPFKCAHEINARAYQLLADEFFGGVDRTPPCP